MLEGGLPAVGPAPVSLEFAPPAVGPAGVVPGDPAGDLGSGAPPLSLSPPGEGSEVDEFDGPGDDGAVVEEPGDGTAEEDVVADGFAEVGAVPFSSAEEGGARGDVAERSEDDTGEGVVVAVGTGLLLELLAVLFSDWPLPPDELADSLVVGWADDSSSSRSNSRCLRLISSLTSLASRMSFALSSSI